jgi:hypothetical protein
MPKLPHELNFDDHRDALRNALDAAKRAVTDSPEAAELLAIIEIALGRSSILPELVAIRHHHLVAQRAEREAPAAA